MRSFALPIIATLLAAAPAAAADRPKGEERLAKALEGRVAGKPVNCINLRQIRSSQIIDRTAIIYDAGNVLYVNRPRNGAESLDNWDTLVTKTSTSQLCSVDVVQTYDTSSRINTGFVFLGDFVPYRRASPRN